MQANPDRIVGQRDILVHNDTRVLSELVQEFSVPVMDQPRDQHQSGGPQPLPGPDDRDLGQLSVMTLLTVSWLCAGSLASGA